MTEYPPNCDMDYSHCDGVDCRHGAPDDYHDCGIPECTTGAICGDTGPGALAITVTTMQAHAHARATVVFPRERVTAGRDFLGDLRPMLWAAFGERGMDRASHQLSFNLRPAGTVHVDGEEVDLAEQGLVALEVYADPVTERHTGPIPDHLDA